MSGQEPKRRSPGEGSVWEYRTKAGVVRWAIGYVRLMPDGTHKSVTRRVGPNGEKWTTKKAAQTALRAALAAADKGELVDPERMLTGSYLDEWIEGLRLGPSTVASYRKNVRLHIKPYIGSVPMAKLTTTRIDAMYRELERSGRRDGKGERTGEPLSARTVRYVATILSAALTAAVRSHRLAHNPAATASPPTARQARAPEMHPWTAGQLAAFLAWSAQHASQHTAWHLLAMTGMRRGEALALRWRDLDLEAGTIRVQRSAGVVRNAGEGAAVVEGATKTGKSRVIDIDPGTVALLRTHRRSRGTLALQLARDDALVLGDHEGAVRHPERFSRTFKAELARCAKALGDGAPPEIRLHDLRHTHATLLLAAGEPVKVVSERLGHATAMITLNVYQAVLPGMQRQAADLFARLVGEAGAAGPR